MNYILLTINCEEELDLGYLQLLPTVTDFWIKNWNITPTLYYLTSDQSKRDILTVYCKVCYIEPEKDIPLKVQRDLFLYYIASKNYNNEHVILSDINVLLNKDRVFKIKETLFGSTRRANIWNTFAIGVWPKFNGTFKEFIKNWDNWQTSFNIVTIDLIQLKTPFQSYINTYLDIIERTVNGNVIPESLLYKQWITFNEYKKIADFVVDDAYFSYKRFTGKDIKESGKVIFIDKNYMSTFFKYIFGGIFYPFIVISNIDCDLGYLENPLIMKWYTTYTSKLHSKIELIPIGLPDFGLINSGFDEKADQYLYKDKYKALIDKDYNFHLRILGGIGGVKGKYNVNIQCKSYIEFLLNAREYPFIYCESDYEVYTSILLGSIPIILKSNMDYSKLPILVINNEEEIDYQLLIKTFDYYKTKPEIFRDNPKLTLSYWKQRIRSNVIVRNFETIKVNRVILSCDNHPNYIHFWKFIAKAWINMGITPTLFYITDDISESIEGEELGEVIKWQSIDGMAKGFQAQCIRLLAPALYPNDFVIISDMDMLPLKKEYFMYCNKFHKDSFIVYRPFNLIPEGIGYNYHEHEIPMCYNVASGKIYSEIFGVNDQMDINELLQKWYPKEYPVVGWTTDQVQLYSYLHRWKGSKVYVGDALTKFKRLDRVIDPNNVDITLFCDYHLPRPYTNYSRFLDPFFERINCS